MKHNVKITAILLAMFLVTQIIGLIVINAYSPKQESFYNATSGQYEIVNVTPQLPYGMQPPEVEPASGFSSIIIAFVIAIVLMFILMKFKVTTLLRFWFFFVVVIAIAISLNAFLQFPYSSLIAILVSLPLAFYKVFKRNMIVHNLTELLIYPGIATVFVLLFSQWAGAGVILILVLLVLISLYDMWAVWQSKIMQKMAKFQMNELKFFAGFFVPYLGKKEREQIKAAKKLKGKGKEKTIKVNLAILGGGDVIFPIITAGIFFTIYSIVPALFIIAGATLALMFLFILSEKKKFYPAMPFITGGIFIALLLWKLLTLI